MSKRKLPDHIPGTVRQWRVRKRREFRAVLKAWEVYWSASAYTPPHSAWTGLSNTEMMQILRGIEQSLRGRWNP